MKDLAAYIVDSKTIHFGPSQFIDRYETALVELLRAKQEGRVMEPPEEPAPHRVINPMDALRASIGAETKKSRPRPVLADAAPPKGRCEAEAARYVWPASRHHKG
jgi:DNA end-binding protein Ku